jgi:sRNA-binding protein
MSDTLPQPEHAPPAGAARSAGAPGIANAAVAVIVPAADAAIDAPAASDAAEASPAQASAQGATPGSPVQATDEAAAAGVDPAAHADAEADADADADADAGPAHASAPSDGEGRADAPPAASAADAAPAPADLSPAQCSARLATLFPALFALQQPLPLKLRIQADIQQRAPGIFNRKSLSGFLHRYTTGTPYLAALTRHPQRFDLDGLPAGEVAQEHRDAATTEVARRRGLMDARRAAEQAARREAENAERAARREADKVAREARQQQEAQQSADQQGRRERAALLRAFDTSTLTRANFCALKGLAEADLENLLVQARREAAERPAWQPAEERGAANQGRQDRHDRQDRRDGPVRPDRPPRPDPRGAGFNPGRRDARPGGAPRPTAAVTPGDRPASGPGNRPRRPRPAP